MQRRRSERDTQTTGFYCQGRRRRVRVLPRPGTRGAGARGLAGRPHPRRPAPRRPRTPPRRSPGWRRSGQARPALGVRFRCYAGQVRVKHVLRSAWGGVRPSVLHRSDPALTGTCTRAAQSRHARRPRNRRCTCGAHLCFSGRAVAKSSRSRPWPPLNGLPLLPSWGPTSTGQPPRTEM